MAKFKFDFTKIRQKIFSFSNEKNSLILFFQMYAIILSYSFST